MSNTDFFERYSKDAKNSVLFPSVALAQSALESGYGKSLLSSQYNNMFGIKAHSGWDGAIVNMNTLEYFDSWTSINDGFKAYKNPKDSFIDHSAFLKRYNRYSDTLNASNPIDQMKKLGASGYATDPNYYSKLKSIYDKYDLAKYDSISNNSNLINYSVIGVVLILLIIYIKKG